MGNQNGTAETKEAPAIRYWNRRGCIVRPSPSTVTTFDAVIVPRPGFVMKTRQAKFDRNMLFISNVGRMLGISPCGCTPMLLGCDCHADSCKCEAEIQVCRYERTPGFLDVEWPEEEAERADREAEEFRRNNPGECEEMLRHHDAWAKADVSFDGKMAELLRILDPTSYADRPYDAVSISAIRCRSTELLARQERVASGLSPYDAPATLAVDYKVGETLTHNRNGRGACHTGDIGKKTTVLTQVTLDPNDYESIRRARIEHAGRP